VQLADSKLETKNGHPKGNALQGSIGFEQPLFRLTSQKIPEMRQHSGNFVVC
jgi:hypothetical protein